jgi:hypothetical protein
MVSQNDAGCFLGCSLIINHFAFSPAAPVNRWAIALLVRPFRLWQEKTG